MAVFQGIMFLFFGLGFLLMDFRSLKSGWLPCGSNGLKGRLELRRDDQPLVYWVLFTLYGAGGARLVVFSLRLLTGLAEPIPLR